jgi:hypothetical protein
MIFQILSPKNSAKKCRFFTRNKAKLFKVLIITLVFEKNAIFAENCRKSQKNCNHNIDPCSNINARQNADRPSNGAFEMFPICVVQKLFAYGLFTRNVFLSEGVVRHPKQS